MRENTDWTEVLEEFRRLGGSADNICLRNGPFGRGVFPIDPSLPVLVRAPENLLLPVEEATFQDNKFRVAENSKMGSAEKTWLEYYMENYSWGGGGRAEIENYFSTLANLPEQVRETLTSSFSMSVPRAPPCARIQARFLNTRVIGYNKRRVVMPIVELINHGDLAGYDCTNGVAVGGTFAGEVLVNYGLNDPFMVYRAWGFASRKRTALSLPIGFSTEFGEIRVKNELDEREPFWFEGVEMAVPLPKLTLEDGTITLSFIVLGWQGFPRMPKGVFRRLFREAGHAITDEPFERLQYANRLRFLELLTELEGVRGAVAARTLRAMCYYQLEALAHSYGAREL
jgi:hypothetical protein